MGTMVDMMRNEGDDSAEEAAMPGDEGQYPYGLCINLDKDELDKLGIKTLPPIGCEVHMVAVGKVTRVSQSATEIPGGTDEQTSIAIQITMMSADLKMPDMSMKMPSAGTSDGKTLMEKY